MEAEEECTVHFIQVMTRFIVFILIFCRQTVTIRSEGALACVNLAQFNELPKVIILWLSLN